MTKYYGPEDDLSNRTVELTEDAVFDHCISMVNTRIVKTTQGISINCQDATTSVNGEFPWAG